MTDQTQQSGNTNSLMLNRFLVRIENEVNSLPNPNDTFKNALTMIGLRYYQRGRDCALQSLQLLSNNPSMTSDEMAALEAGDFYSFEKHVEGLKKQITEYFPAGFLSWVVQFIKLAYNTGYGDACDLTSSTLKKMQR